MVRKSKIIRYVCILLVLLQLLPFVAMAAPEEEAELFNTSLAGDVNGDEVVDRNDLELLSAHVAKIEQIEDESMLANADVNGDGEISAADMTALSGKCTVDSDLRLAEVSVDKETADVGSEFEWSAQAFGGEGQIQYAFELFKMDAVAAVSDLDQGQDSASKTMVASQDYSTKNSFRVKLDEGGLFAATIYCMDEQGTVCEWPYASPVTVKNTSFDGIKVKVATGTYVVPGMPVSWNVVCQGGNAPFTYQYTLYYNNTEIDSAQTGTPSYSVESCAEGQYSLKVICTDVDGRVQSATSETVFVTGKSISAPELTLANDAYSLSATEASAMEIPVNALQLQWEAVENAEYYGLAIEKQTASGWIAIADANVTQCSYTIDQKLLNALPAETLCKVIAWSQGSSSSNEVPYYFKIKEVATEDGDGTGVGTTELTIDGETSLTWTVASADIATRTFTVYPKNGWEVSADVDWVSLLPNRNEFWAVLQENSGDTRTGTITVTYGEQTVTINVTQGSAAEPPVLVYPGYSQDPDAPTEIPVGGMIMKYDNNKAPYVGLKFYEVTTNGLKEVCNKVERAWKKWVQVSPDELKANTDYILELSGYETENGDNEDDVLSSRYYIRMVEGGHILSLEGTDSIHKSTLDNFDIKLYCNGGWTWEADVDWLRPEEFLSMVFFENYQRIGIELDPNYAETERTGTITFRYGDQSATLTVTQDSWLPRFVVPANLSEDMSNPTILPGDRVLEDYVCKDASYATFENGAWSEEITKSSTSDRIDRNVAYKDEQHYDTGVLHRFTLKSGEYTKIYYVKYDTGEKSPYALLRTTNGTEHVELSWEMPATKSERELRLYTSGKWQIKSNCSWLSASSTNGETAASYKKIMVYADDNLTGEERVGVLTVYSEGTACAQIRVTQTAKDYFLLLLENAEGIDIACNTNQYFSKIDGAGDSIPVEAWTNASLNVSSNVSWITYSSKRVRIEENTSGAERTGSVTFTCGNADPITVDFTQVTELQKPVVSPVLSTSSKNPSVRAYEDMHITWEAVEGAVKYTVSVMPADYDLAIDGLHSYEKEIPATDAAVYNWTIPSSAFSLNCDDYDKLKVYAHDQWGYASVTIYYFISSSAECVRLNGSMTPIWENATDVATSQDFAVRATGPWTASANSNWILLNKTSGTESDTLTVSLVANTGEARTGEVYVKTGNSTTVLTVNQCAYLPEFPTIKSPAFSDDVGSPTVIGDTTSLHVTWDYAPQVEYYEVTLLSHKDKSVWHPEKRSPEMKTDEYTFENLELVPGLCYQIQLIRKSHWGPTGHCIYFTVSDENAFVLVDGRELEECWYDSTEDYEYFNITSSGTWTATVSDNWLLADNKKIGQEKLDELEALPEYYSSFYGKNGDRLCITALANPTDAYRYGTVTVQCGGATAEIKIAQPPYYEIATLQSPQLGNDKNEPTVLPYGPVTLRWGGAVGGTGTYRILLREREKGSTYRYDTIFEKDNISSTKYTLPMDLLTEGQYYEICLVTNVPGGYGDGCWYYFRMGYENELTVSADVDWSNVSVNGSVTVRASASGGAGSYLYAYELLKDGSQVDITELGKWDSYGFSINEPGTYQIKVFCRDAQNFSAQSYSGTYTYGEDRFDSISLSQTSWKVAAAGGSQSVSVSANGNWSVESCPSWITCSRTEGSGNISLTLSANKNTSTQRTGTVTFVSGDARTAIHVTQESAVLKTSITYPVKASSVSVSDLAIVWTAVAEADSYLLSVRDLTTDLLLLNQMSTTETSYTLSGSSLAENHSYRVAVGVVVGSQTWWTESTFITKVDKGPADMGKEDSGSESETPVQHNYTRVNVGTPKLINQSLEIHDVLTTYYEVCSICGDKTAEKTEAISTPHAYSNTNRYEAAHPHKLFQRCECGAVKYLDGQYKTGNGTVQEAAKCCICHGHSFDTANPKEVNGKWRAYCTKCGNYKTVEAPQSSEPEACTHPYGFPGRKTITVADEVTNVNEKYFHMRRTERKTGDCCGCGAMNPSSVSTSVYSVQEPHVFSGGSSACNICGYQSATGGFEYTDRYILYVESKYYVGDYVYAGIGEHLSVRIYDTFEGKTYQDGTGDNIEIVLVDPDGIAKLENNVFVARDSGKCNIVLTYYGKKVDTLPIGVTVLSVKDTFWSYNAVSSGAVRIDDLNGINWKSANVRVTPGVAIGEYSAVQNSNGSYTVRFNAYNRSAEVIGFQVFDDEGNRYGTQTAIVKAHWGTGSFVGSMVDTFKETSQIWNSKSYDEKAEVTEVALTVPEGGYIQVVDMSEDTKVWAANICEFIVGTIKLKDSGESIVNPTDISTMEKVLEYLGEDELLFVIWNYLVRSEITFSSFVEDIGEYYTGMEYMANKLLNGGLMDNILVAAKAAAVSAGDKIEDGVLMLINPGLYYIKHGIALSYASAGLKELTNAYSRSRNGRTEKYVGHIIVPHRDTFSIPNKNSSINYSMTRQMLLMEVDPEIQTTENTILHEQPVLFTQQTDNVAVFANTTSANVGDTIELHLQTNDMTVTSFTCGVSFDSEVLSVVSVTKTPIITAADGGTWNATAVSTPEQANENGTVGFAFANSEERAYVGGAMATITFEVIKAGSTEIVLYEDSDGLNGQRSDAVDTIDCVFGGAGANAEEVEIVLDEQTETSATITVTNCSDGELAACIVVAAYDVDGKQVGNAVAREVFAPQTPVEVTVDYSTAADKIKAFLLDPVSWRPLNAAKQFPEE